MRHTTAFLSILLCLTVISGSTEARNRGQYQQTNPEVKKWIEGLENKKGTNCCDSSDGYPPEAIWDIGRNKYKVMIKGEWYDVPEYAVINGPNKLGRAVVWYHIDFEGVFIRCFLPGVLA